MLRLLIRARDVIANLQSPLAKKDALAVFLALARDSDPAKLWGWLSQDHERVRCFISLLRDAAEAFEVKRDNAFVGEENPAVLSGQSQSGIFVAASWSECIHRSVVKRSSWASVHGGNNFNFTFAQRCVEASRPRTKIQQRKGTKGEDIIAEPLSIASSLLGGKSEMAQKDARSGVGSRAKNETNVLEAIMGGLAALLRRSQSATSWLLQAPLLNAVIRNVNTCSSSLCTARRVKTWMAFSPLEAPYPGTKPFAFLESACVALLRCAARPQPARSLAVGGLRALLESALDVGGGVECLRPTLTYALLQGLKPFGHNARAGGVSRALRALSEPVSSTNGASQSPANWKSATNSHSLQLFQKLASERWLWRQLVLERHQMFAAPLNSKALWH